MRGDRFYEKQKNVINCYRAGCGKVRHCIIDRTYEWGFRNRVFGENPSLLPVDSGKNPVSLVEVRKSRSSNIFRNLRGTNPILDFGHCKRLQVLILLNQNSAAGSNKWLRRGYSGAEKMAADGKLEKYKKESDRTSGERAIASINQYNVTSSLRARYWSIFANVIY
jgi:hypothetical protein